VDYKPQDGSTFLAEQETRFSGNRTRQGGTEVETDQGQIETVSEEDRVESGERENSC
jgi:hypothetical protein